MKIRPVVRVVAALVAFGVLCWGTAQAAELEVDGGKMAGDAVEVRTSGSGSATLYLVGPVTALKRSVKLGETVTLNPEETQAAGRYVAILRSGSKNSQRVFWIGPAKPASISFLARPSRLPVGISGGISGVAYVFDSSENLVVEPQNVRFQLGVADQPAQSRTVISKNGLAWTRADSGTHEGAAQFIASVDEISEKRVVQLAASDPCNLRIEAKRGQDGIEVTTLPIRDCGGNPVPDGTIVTFSAMTPRGKSTVDARIRKGVATAQFPTEERAVISVASGVVMGNEVRVQGGR